MGNLNKQIFGLGKKEVTYDENDLIRASESVIDVFQPLLGGLITRTAHNDYEFLKNPHMEAERVAAISGILDVFGLQDDLVAGLNELDLPVYGFTYDGESKKYTNWFEEPFFESPYQEKSRDEKIALLQSCHQEIAPLFLKLCTCYHMNKMFLTGVDISPNANHIYDGRFLYSSGFGFYKNVLSEDEKVNRFSKFDPEHPNSVSHDLEKRAKLTYEMETIVLSNLVKMSVMPNLLSGNTMMPNVNYDS